ncbi:MAG: RES family NAD+ phosphorylase [Burkholderiales bacterium]|nr:RES family NAD+ phosphorylase [Burkholderiales bacterium]
MYGNLCAANADFHGDLVRNIKTNRASQDLFDDLATDPRDRAVAIAAEARERVATSAAVVTRPFDYGTVASYAFDPAHWQATRFSDARRFGVWYGALNTETTVHETVFHWHRFLADSYGAQDRVIVGERRLFDVRCDALLVDLRGREDAYPDLLDRRSYAFTQPLGAWLFDQGANGILVDSARSRGVNGAILRRERLSNVRDRMFLTYRCNPARDSCDVERAPGEIWLRIPPSTLY